MNMLAYRSIEREAKLNGSVRAKWQICNRDFVDELPTYAGVYALYTGHGNVIYVGSARNLRHRLMHHSKMKEPFVKYLKFRGEREYGESAMAELKLIMKIQPTLNIQCKR